jgi:tetratricopeptide (TPR) repeat protein
VEAAFEGDGPRQVEKRPFSFTLSAQEAEDIRWYLEDYRIYPVDPQPKIAARIEHRMEEIGRELFQLVLGGSNVWHSARGKLGETRVEIETELEGALVPWELMRDPEADRPLALEGPSFVRCHPRPARTPNPLAAPAMGKIRVLLAICRPREGDDVPFRSVARHLIRGLTDTAREPFDLEVLRPPTFEQLARRLRQAKAQGEAFHALHFDGHGLAGEIFFENPEIQGNAQAIKPADLGNLLHESSVPLLILNACRSAASEPPEKPEEVRDLHQNIREFGSFAHAVMDCGATGAVAWRYSVFVDTAAQYMTDLYGALASGLPLGEAATLARKQLSSAVRPIQDWTVPAVFEAAPVQLFPKSESVLDIKLETPAVTDTGLPHPPDIGFIGRDETILKLDRTFDGQNIVLLHAYAGSGKTSTVAEFARWYHQTGGLEGPVLFTSFEQHKTLPGVLDELGRVFEGVLAKNGIQWLTLDDPRRHYYALQILQQIPVLWIWDNVEPVAGFPSGTPSAWSAAEQKELLEFLKAARGTKAKFLLTSRRDERAWLHELPARIELPPMRFDDCVQMIEELAKKRGRRLGDVDDWRPLIRFMQGNPLTLTVVVGQALRDGLHTRDQIVDFVRKLQTGESAFQDEISEGRTRSLAASLSYGFESAFTEAERRQLALLHLFQGFVDVDALRLMGDPAREWCLPELEDITRETGIALLDRASDAGLLTALHGGYYLIHPALPWFFRQLFEQNNSKGESIATRAFVEAIGHLGEYYLGRYATGDRDVIGILIAEEGNLLQAWGLARRNGWHRGLIRAMQGLRILYEHTGRITEWSRLVEEIVPDFVDPATGGPLPGKEEEWSLVTSYRVRLAQGTRQWDEAESLLNASVRWNRRRAAPILVKAQESWSANEKNVLRTLAASLLDLADVRRRQGSASCVEGYREALALAEAIQDSQVAATCAFNLGHAYADLNEIRDFALAERWYRQSLDQRPKEDRMGRARCLLQLGTVARQRSLEVKSEEEHFQQLAQGVECYTQALKMLPLNAPQDLAITHNQLGNAYSDANQIETALHHYRESIRYKEAMHDRFAAGLTRYNVALLLANAGRLADGHEWAQAALRDYRASENADREVTETLQLLEQIESRLRATSPPSSTHPPQPH